MAINDQETSVTFARSAASGWLVASFVPIETLTESTLTIGKTTFLTLAICLGLMGILAAIYTRSLVRPIREITSAFE